MSMLHRAIGMAALLASIGDAQAATRSACLTPAEANALATVLMPDVALAVGKQCAATLPPEAMLRNGLPPLVARWRAEGTALRPAAGGAVIKMAGMSGSSVDGAAMLDAMGPGLIADMVKTIDPKTCGIVDRAIALLAPLPSANLAGLVVLAMQEGGGGRGQMICTPARQ